MKELKVLLDYLSSTDKSTVRRQLQMKHKVELVHNLMYKGCEPHWHCTQCDVYIPIHCYTKEELENMDCKENKDDLRRSS